MPKGSRSSQYSHLSQSLLLDVHRCTIDQLTRLAAEVLWLHLSSRHLFTSGNKSVMAQRLYHALRNTNHSSSIVTTTTPPVLTSPTSTTTLCQSTTALSMPSTISPPLNSMRPTMSTSAAMSSIPYPAITSEVSFQPELQLQLTSLMSRLIQRATAAVASQIAHTTPNPLPATTLDAPSTREIQLSAAVIPSKLVNTSDNLLPASTLDTPPPPRNIATATQMIQPTYYTTPPLQNLPVTAHGQQFSLTQQIPAWPAAYIPSSTVSLPPAASYPQSFSLPLFHAGNQTASIPSSYIPTSQLQNSTSPLIPVQLRQQILQGKYVDFAMLSHRAKFSEVSEVPVSSYRPPAIKRIISFDIWMQAWNLYLAVILAHNPL